VLLKGAREAARGRRRNAEMAERSMLSLLAGELPELTVNREVKWRWVGWGPNEARRAGISSCATIAGAGHSCPARPLSN